MDNSIVEFFNRKTRTVTAIVDQTFFRLMETTAPIDSYMPVRNYAARELLLLKWKHSRPTIASIVAEEQEIPISRSRAQINEESIGNLKIGKQYVFKAKDYELMQKMRQYLSSGGANTSAIAADLEKYFFGVAADLVPSVVEKMTMLTFKVFVTGQCVYTDPLSGAETSLVYPDTIASHFPAALTGNARWSQSATANPLTDLETHATNYYNNLGMWPEAIAFRWATIRQIADCVSTKKAYMAQQGTPTDATDETSFLYLEDQQVMDLIRRRTRCQKILMFDAMYAEELADGSTPESYHLPDNYYTFLSSGNVERAMVPTVERDFQPGIYFNTRVLNDAPRQERAVAVGNGVPFVLDARKLAARRVA